MLNAEVGPKSTMLSTMCNKRWTFTFFEHFWVSTLNSINKTLTNVTTILLILRRKGGDVCNLEYLLCMYAIIVQHTGQFQAQYLWKTKPNMGVFLVKVLVNYENGYLCIKCNCQGITSRPWQRHGSPASMPCNSCQQMNDNCEKCFPEPCHRFQNS